MQGQNNQINIELQEQTKKWEGKLGELQKKSESGMKEINKELKKQNKGNQELREKAVSYTHLDVYKRQGWSQPGTCKGRE